MTPSRFSPYPTHTGSLTLERPVSRHVLVRVCLKKKILLKESYHTLDGHFVFCPVDNYLALEVACTLSCPPNNQEVVVTQPDGTETQKCDKCEGDCPKGEVVILFSSGKYHIVYKHMHTVAALLDLPAN